MRLRDDFLEAINPQLIFINGAANVIKGSVNYCDKKHISYLLGYKGLTRMRTDGNIWVIDYLKEKNADRDLPYTPERSELRTKIPKSLGRDSYEVSLSAHRQR